MPIMCVEVLVLGPTGTGNIYVGMDLGFFLEFGVWTHKHSMKRR